MRLRLFSGGDLAIAEACNIKKTDQRSWTEIYVDLFGMENEADVVAAALAATH